MKEQKSSRNLLKNLQLGTRKIDETTRILPLKQNGYNTIQQNKKMKFNLATWSLLTSLEIRLLTPTRACIDFVFPLTSTIPLY